MITFVNESGNVTGIAQDCYKFSYLLARGDYFILEGIIHSPTDYGAVARALSRLIKQTEVKSYA